MAHHPPSPATSSQQPAAHSVHHAQRVTTVVPAGLLPPGVPLDRCNVGEWVLTHPCIVGLGYAMTEKHNCTGLRISASTSTGTLVLVPVLLNYYGNSTVQYGHSYTHTDPLFDSRRSPPHPTPPHTSPTPQLLSQQWTHSPPAKQQRRRVAVRCTNKLYIKCTPYNLEKVSVAEGEILRAGSSCTYCVRHGVHGAAT